MDKLRVGQKVRVINAISRKDLIGSILTITHAKQLLDTDLGWAEVYIVDASPGRGFRAVGFVEEHLEPVYDGDEKSSWSESVWKPKELIKE